MPGSTMLMKSGVNRGIACFMPDRFTSMPLTSTHHSVYHHRMSDNQSGGDDGPVIADPRSGMFCLPGCSGLPEADCELRAYPSAKNALEWGFRPCPVCRPLDIDGCGGSPPDESREILRLMDDIASDPDFRIREHQIASRGINPDRIRRIYQSRFDMSFQDYLRMRRVNRRFGFPSVADSACGNAACGDKPGGDDAAGANHDVFFTRIGTPLGPMLTAATGMGISLLEFAERRMMETQIQRLEKFHGERMGMGVNPHLLRLVKELTEYFKGRRRVFSVPLDIRGTDFQMHVWEELRRIPYGSTRSYGDQARALGNPSAVRAVARANGDNPLSIIVPCHRVLGADGSMTGYGGRIWRKEALLRLESSQGELFG